MKNCSFPFVGFSLVKTMTSSRGNYIVLVLQFCFSNYNKQIYYTIQCFIWQTLNHDKVVEGPDAGMVWQQFCLIEAQTACWFFSSLPQYMLKHMSTNICTFQLHQTTPSLSALATLGMTETVVIISVSAQSLSAQSLLKAPKCCQHLRDRKWA